MVQKSGAVADKPQRGNDMSAEDPIEADTKRNLADASRKIISGPQSDRTGDGRTQSLATATEALTTAIEARYGGNDNTNTTTTVRSTIEPTGAAGEKQQTQIRPAAKEIVQPRTSLGNGSEDLIAAPPPVASKAARGATPLSHSGGRSEHGGAGAAVAGLASTQEQRRRSIVERSLDTAREKHRKREEDRRRQEEEQKEEEEEKMKRGIRRKRERLTSKAAREGQYFYDRLRGTYIRLQSNHIQVHGAHGVS